MFPELHDVWILGRVLTIGHWQSAFLSPGLCFWLSAELAVVTGCVSVPGVVHVSPLAHSSESCVSLLPTSDGQCRMVYCFLWVGLFTSSGQGLVVYTASFFAWLQFCLALPSDGLSGVRFVDFTICIDLPRWQQCAISPHGFCAVNLSWLEFKVQGCQFERCEPFAWETSVLVHCCIWPINYVVRSISTLDIYIYCPLNILHCFGTYQWQWNDALV
jgi:hypothetical protein